MIKIKTFVFNNLQVNSFVLHDETNKAILIDPACQFQQERLILSEYIESNKLTPVKIVLTHGHIDHLIGINFCIEKYKVPLIMHPDDLFLLSAAPEISAFYGFDPETIHTPDSFINEGEELKFGNSVLSIIHIPGHSPGSILFYSVLDKFLIAGDVLFNGSIGRTDLPGGDYDSLINGIRTKLLNLPPDTVVFPGHGPSTTIKTESDTNPFLI